MDFFNDYRWHSSVEMTKDIAGKKIVRRLNNTASNRNRFIRVASDSDFLIHKSAKVLWRFSDDGKSIVPVFDDDTLTESNL